MQHLLRSAYIFYQAFTERIFHTLIIKQIRKPEFQSGWSFLENPS